jgi:methylamine dehydrogenase light chain
MSLFDDVVQKGTRFLAGRTSRRSMLGRLGRTLGGAAVAFPVLPVDRVAKFAAAATAATDDQTCEYWRHCASTGSCAAAAAAAPPAARPGPPPRR